MPVFRHEQLKTIAVRVLQGAGVSQHKAAIVAEELAEANLVGHDSHGVIRLKQYVDYIGKQVIDPHGEVTTIHEYPALAVLDGGKTFGQVVGRQALQLATSKARETGAYTVFCRESNHLGRLGSYTHAAALAGFAAVLAVNGPGVGGAVAPWGAAERRMGTNPISMAVPWNDAAIVLDMTTSATAEGKVRVAYQKGVPLPDGWIIDAEGKPSTDPADIYADPPGAILPLGGSLGFKGYGLSVMMDMFCGVLSGSGAARKDREPGTNGVWLAVYDISKLLDPNEYQGWVEQYVTWLKTARRAPGVDEILLPGEIEQQRRQQRVADGVELPEGTWTQIRELASAMNVSLDDLGSE